MAVQTTEDLIGFPNLPVPELAKLYNVSFEAANKAVARLLNVEVIAQVGEQTYGRAFAAAEVIAALPDTDSPERLLTDLLTNGSSEGVISNKDLAGPGSQDAWNKAPSGTGRNQPTPKTNNS